MKGKGWKYGYGIICLERLIGSLWLPITSQDHTQYWPYSGCLIKDSGLEAEGEADLRLKEMPEEKTAERRDRDRKERR